MPYIILYTILIGEISLKLITILASSIQSMKFSNLKKSTRKKSLYLKVPQEIL